MAFDEANFWRQVSTASQIQKYLGNPSQIGFVCNSDRQTRLEVLMLCNRHSRHSPDEHNKRQTSTSPAYNRNQVSVRLSTKMDANENEVAALWGDKLQSTTPLSQDDRVYVRLPAITALYVWRNGPSWIQRLQLIPPGQLIIRSLMVLYLILPIFSTLPIKVVISWIALHLLSLGASMHMWKCLLEMDLINWSLFTWPMSLQVSSIRRSPSFILWTENFSHF